MPCHSPAATSIDFDGSPGLTATRSTAIFRPERLSATRRACGSWTFSSVMTTACDTFPRAVKKGAGLREVARADFDVVAALGQIDADGLRSGGHGNS